MSRYKVIPFFPIHKSLCLLWKSSCDFKTFKRIIICCSSFHFYILHNPYENKLVCIFLAFSLTIQFTKYHTNDHHTLGSIATSKRFEVKNNIPYGCFLFHYSTFRQTKITM